MNEKADIHVGKDNMLVDKNYKHLLLKILELQKTAGAHNVGEEGTI